jgi:prolyl-tRNA editing enzyme YbaK/EbsC (Cys-tRNA(Pro) deacylase)
VASCTPALHPLPRALRHTCLADGSARVGESPAAAVGAPAAGGGPPSAARRVKSMVLSAGDAPLVVVAPAGSTLDLGKVRGELAR